MSSHQSCKNCRERQEELLESGDGSQVICYCYDGLTDEELTQLKLEEVFADEVTSLVLNEIQEAFSPVGDQFGNDEGSRLKIDEDISNSSQLEEVFAGSSRCKTSDVSCNDGVCADPTSSDDYVAANPPTQSRHYTTPNNEAVGKSKQPPAIKKRVNDSSKLSMVGFEPPIKKRLFPADDEFNTCLKLSSTIRKWRKIPENVVFQVLGVEIKGAGENPYIANLQSDDGDVFMVWIRPRIYNQLSMYDMTKKIVYIKSLGLKPCKSDPMKKYFDFAIIAKDL